jgi:hypothetical protein
MKSFDYDLRYLKAAIEDLESYLLSDHLYWSLDAKTQASEPVFPNLTLGNLLLSKARLQARHLTLEQEVQLGSVLAELEKVRSQWRVAWSKKAARSLQNRLSMWRDFLDEYRKKPEANADRYAYEVQRRAMLDLLLPEVDEVSNETIVLISKLDALLKTFLVRGNFIWEEELRGGFPEDEFWYLYGILPERLTLAEDY